MSRGQGDRAVTGVGLFGLWLFLIVSGTAWLWRHQLTPGDGGTSPGKWPSASELPPPAGRPKLVMVAHPRCPCTRASLTELARLMTRLEGKIDAQVIFVRPAGTDAAWSHTDTFERASSLRGVTVFEDLQGKQAALFGANTSGHVYLYGSHRDLLFSGGITSARGHEGDNAGSDRIRALVLNSQSLPTLGDSASAAAVFGCALQSLTPEPR